MAWKEKEIVLVIIVSLVGFWTLSSAYGETVLSTGFESPTFNETDWSNNAVNGVDGSSTNEGIWWATNSTVGSAGVPYAVTWENWGETGLAVGDSGLGITSTVAQDMVTQVDIGQELSGSTSLSVVVQFSLKRELRGPHFGGFTTAETTFDGTKALFGVRYNKDYDQWHYYENGVDMGLTGDVDSGGWGTITFTLDFIAGTYDLAIPTANINLTGINMNSNASYDSLRYLLWFQDNSADVKYDNLSVEHTPGVVTAVLSTGFEEPPFEEDDWYNNTVNGIDGSATSEGLWWASNSTAGSAGGPYAVTWKNHGQTGPAVGDSGMTIHAGEMLGVDMYARVDLGTTLSSEAVTITFDSKREYRGFYLGGYEAAETAWDDTKALFGIWCHWSDLWSYLADDQWKGTGVLVPSGLGWAKYKITLNFPVGTYDVSIEDNGYNVKVFEAPLNPNVSLRHLLFYFVRQSKSEAKFDNLRVVQRTYIPPPSPPEWVDASTFGFDPCDATIALQDAIDTGATTVFVPNMGTDWVVRPIFLRRSNQTIEFDDGVVVTAKNGAFTEIADCLFTISEQQNVTLLGNGSILRMQKSEYTSGEHRHALKVINGNSINISGLTFRDSGGDGIYLGGIGNQNIIISNVTCYNNRRNAVSVISAENLLIEDCKLVVSNGTNPQSGIDFEANGEEYVITNCILRNCRIAANTNRGIVFANIPNGGDFNGTVENCTIWGNTSHGIQVNASMQPQVTIENCIIASNTGYGIESGGLGNDSVTYTAFYGNVSGTTDNSSILGTGIVTGINPNFVSTDVNDSQFLYLDGSSPTSIIEGASDLGPMGYKPSCGNAAHPYPVGDLNGDCKVNFGDYAILAVSWLDSNCGFPDGWCAGADLDQSDEVDWPDIEILSSKWLEIVEPNLPYSF